MRLLPLVAAFMLLPLVPPAHADPGGVDAPEPTSSTRPVPSTEVGEGTFEGNLSNGPDGKDIRDSYHYAHPYGKGARITVWSSSPRFAFESSVWNAQMPRQAFPAPAPNGSGYQLSNVLAASGGAQFFVTLQPGISWLEYVVTVEQADVADLEVVSLTATRVADLGACLPCAGPREKVRIEMTVRAIGDLPYDGHLDVEAWGSDAGYVSFGGAHVILPPHATMTLVVDWTAIVTGDVLLHGRASTERDSNYWNNDVRATYSSSVAGAPGVIVA